MDLYGIGFSNIRFASDSANNVHKYNYRMNTFSEEVFIHEFLHTLERTCQEFGYEVPSLHSHADYGYKQQALTGLEDWYEDYMSMEILDKSTNTYVGLNEKVYVLQPVNEDNFKFALEIEFNDEPDNLLEEIKSLFNVVAEAI